MNATQCRWRPAPPLAPPLADDDLHLWRATLDMPADELPRWARLLSPDEHERARRFHFEKDAHRFVARRAALRIMLARYTGTAPAALQFRYGAQGRPELAGAPDTPAVSFNLSDSKHVALYAFTRSRAVGVDIEYLRPLTDLDRVAARILTPREYARLAALPAGSRRAAFFAAWSLKEAYLKAVGQGLIGLPRVEVAIAPDTPALLTIAASEDAARAWFVHPCASQEGFAAAAVVHGGACHISHFDFTFEGQQPR